MTIILFIILLLAVNSLSVIGFHYAVQYQKVPGKGILEETKNILWWLKYYGEKFVPLLWRKPIYGCLRCMPSIHASYVYFPLAMNYLTLDTWIYFACYPVYVLMLSGLMVLIESKFNI